MASWRAKEQVSKSVTDRRKILFLAKSDTVGATGNETTTKHAYVLQQGQCVRKALASLQNGNLNNGVSKTKALC